MNIKQEESIAGTSMTKERLLSETEASQYNLNTAIGNHTGHITCLLMAPLLKRMQILIPLDC